MDEPTEFEDAARPHDEDTLDVWLRETLGVRVPRRALIEGHTPPMAYLAHAFFEGRTRGSWSERGPVDCVVWANRGGGKTFLGAVATVLDMVFKPGIQVRILGGSLEQAGRMHEHLRLLFQTPALAPLIHNKITERRIQLLNGSRVELLAQSERSVRGVRVQKLRCDEVELFDPRVWEAAQLVTRSADLPTHDGLGVRGSVEALSTMHVPHGVMFDIVRSASEGTRRLFKWGVVDVLERCAEGSPCEATGCALPGDCAGKARQIPEGEGGHVPVRDALDMRARVGLAAWESEMLCLRPKRSDAVLPEFERTEHVIAELPEGHESWCWLGGMDFGFRGATVVLWAVLAPTGEVYIAHERSERGQLLGAHIDAILDPEHPRPVWIAVDPAGAQVNEQTGRSNIQQMRSAGLTVRWRRMGIADGLSLVRARLKPADGSGPSVFIHARCSTLIESLERYRYPADRPESGSPVKDGSDHAVDALRYLIQVLDKPYRVGSSRY
ncbi:MAG: hypothetical protein AAGB51_10385 [Planctomycetota bacterium]